MNVLKTLLISAAGLLAAGGTTGALAAGGIISGVISASAPLVFSGVGIASISLTPESGLKAGPYSAGQTIATGDAHSSTTSTIAFRWKAGVGTVEKDGAGLSSVATIYQKEKKAGDKDAAFIKVKLVPSPEVALTDGGDGWMVPKANTSKVDLQVQNVANTVISPGTYTLSVEAVIWGF